MFQMNLSHVISSIVDSQIDRETTEFTPDGHNGLIRPCISISAAISLSKFGGVGVTRSNIIHFMFCGNTNVFTAVNSGNNKWINAFDVPLDRWINTCNHDACWIESGIQQPLNDLYFTMAKDIIAELTQYNQGNIAPADLQHNVHFVGSHAIGNGKLTIVNDELDEDGYRKKIIELTASQK